MYQLDAGVLYMIGARVEHKVSGTIYEVVGYSVIGKDNTIKYLCMGGKADSDWQSFYGFEIQPVAEGIEAFADQDG